MDVLLLRRFTSPFVYQPLKFGRLHKHPLPNPHGSDFPLTDVLPYCPMAQTNGVRSLADTHQKLLHEILFTFLVFSLTNGC
jgi:hypothetical protein